MSIKPEAKGPGFDHIDYLGNINITQLVKVDGPDRYNGNICYFFSEFAKFDPHSADIINENALCREVRPNGKNSSIAINKNDTSLTYPCEGDKNYQLALNYTWMHLAPYLIRPTLDGIDSMSFAGDSSSGVIGLKCGYPKTGRFILSSEFNRYKNNTDYIPLKKINFKNEFLNIEDDLSRNKIRLVDCEDKCFIYKQKFLYDNQNLALLEHNKTHYIKYGMIKQFGGFSDFIISFEDCCLISCTDISGYDKSFFGLDVQDMRNRGLAIGSKGHYMPRNKIVQYTSFYTLNPVRIWYNGDILMQDHSNSSGQNNTTTDNSIEHEIIISHLAIECFNFVFGRDPANESEFRDSFEVGLYSDDKVFGLNYDMDVDDFKIIERNVYAKYGMVIKAAASKAFSHIPGDRFTEEEGVEFLGGTAVWNDRADGYLPKPRVGKLMTSLTRRLDDEPILPIIEQYNKVYSIFELLLCVDQDIKHAVCNFLLFLKNQYSEEMCRLGNDKRVDVSHLTRMVHDDLTNAFDILGWERK